MALPVPPMPHCLLLQGDRFVHREAMTPGSNIFSALCRAFTGYKNEHHFNHLFKCPPPPLITSLNLSLWYLCSRCHICSFTAAALGCALTLYGLSAQ